MDSGGGDAAIASLGGNGPRGGGGVPSPSAALLLNLSLPSIDRTLSSSLPHDATFASAGGVLPSRAAGTPSAASTAAANGAAAPIGADDDDRPHEEYFGEGGGEYDYYGDAGGHEAAGNFEAAAASLAPDLPPPASAQAAGRTSAGRRTSAAAPAAARPAKAATTDPWLPLDPDAVPRGALRPFKAGRTHLILRDPRAVAHRGPLAAAAAAMAEAAAAGARAGASSSGLTVAEARQLKARAETVAVRASALHAASATGSSSRGGPRQVTPLAALSMAGVLMPDQAAMTVHGSWDAGAVPRGEMRAGVAHPRTPAHS